MNIYITRYHWLDTFYMCKYIVDRNAVLFGMNGFQPRIAILLNTRRPKQCHMQKLLLCLVLWAYKAKQNFEFNKLHLHQSKTNNKSQSLLCLQWMQCRQTDILEDRIFVVTIDRLSSAFTLVSEFIFIYNTLLLL